MERPSRGRFEFDRAEVWADGIIHGLGVLFALAAVGILVAATVPARESSELVPILVYGIALVTVLVISAIYNMWPVSPVKWFLRRFDHAAIYVLIAATYTPFLTRLSDDMLTLVMLGLVWIASLVGIVLKIALPGRFDRLSIGLYLLIGWSGVVLWDRILLLPSTSLWLLAAGGLLYTIGVIFYVWENLRFQTAIWHAFVLVAAVCHYGAVFHTAVLAPGA
ncbi:MAG TPA: hemolysin III family protein [Microvirga sp.]|nr:hemolysin III family protein [Microvirga sp.]